MAWPHSSLADGVEPGPGSGRGSLGKLLGIITMIRVLWCGQSRDLPSVLGQYPISKDRSRSSVLTFGVRIVFFFSFSFLSSFFSTRNRTLGEALLLVQHSASGGRCCCKELWEEALQTLVLET